MDVAGGIVGEYQQLASEMDADVLAMQVGDFYEFFGETAELVHEELDLKLSTKPSGGDRFSMAGVPISEIEGYTQALVERGYRVAIADQQDGQNGHERAITRIVTPGNSMRRSTDDMGYLVGVVVEGTQAGISLVDVATGRCYIDRPHHIDTTDDLVEILAGLSVAEVLVDPEADDRDELDDTLESVVVEGDPAWSDPHRGELRIKEHFGETVAEALDIEPVTIRSLGLVLGYLASTDRSLLASLTRLQRYRGADAVSVDATTQRNLELTRTFRGETEGSLLETIDHTTTAAGRRLLAEWLRRPTQAVDQLADRLDAIDALSAEPIARETLGEGLDGTYDVDRLVTRISHGSATPRDLAMLRETLRAIPSLTKVAEAQPTISSSPVTSLLEPLSAGEIEEVRTLLEDRLVEEPPSSVSEGGVICTGWDDDLDEIIEQHETVCDWFDDLANRESRRHGFDRITLGETKADGYYLEVPESDLEAVPSGYQKVKTVSAGTRFRTDELAEKERERYRLEDRRIELEKQAFDTLIASLAEHDEPLREVASALAGLDVRIALAAHAARNGWTRPVFRENGVIEIDQGRHPVVEQTTRFVPNDARFDDSREQLLVTGPNMSGKSTYLRQVALITLLAQIGSFVPAERAAITPVDGIYTRVGALDELAEGRSTFMVEMQELARILHHASTDSLVILDEVGRGTATYDGMSIAWAVVEYLHNHIGAKVLFATHYHELTVLAEHLEGVDNLHVAVEESGDTVAFLHRVEPGSTDRSYGIHVADMAGVPDPVVVRAKDVLDRLREDRAIEARGRTTEGTQVVFDLEGGYTHTASSSSDEDTERVIDELVAVDLTAITPLELVERVRDWQEELERD